MVLADKEKSCFIPSLLGLLTLVRSVMFNDEIFVMFNDNLSRNKLTN